MERLVLKYPGVSAIEVIFNMFRLKQIEALFPLAKKNNVGIIVRVPLASGLLSGIDYELGLEAVNAIKQVFKTEILVPYALRYIMMFDAVSTVIPGASKPHQILDHIKALSLDPLSKDQMDAVDKIYEKYIKSSVHHLW